jgi:hypothetical protein
MNLRLLVLASVLGLSCASGALRPEPRITDANTKIVGVLWPSEITAPLTPEAWRASPWFRDEDDLVTPSRVVIAVDRYACIMRDGDVRVPIPTHNFTCADQWRYPRTRGR